MICAPDLQVQPNLCRVFHDLWPQNVLPMKFTPTNKLPSNRNSKMNDNSLRLYVLYVFYSGQVTYVSFLNVGTGWGTIFFKSRVLKIWDTRLIWAGKLSVDSDLNRFA